MASFLVRCFEPVCILVTTAFFRAPGLISQCACLHAPMNSAHRWASLSCILWHWRVLARYVVHTRTRWLVDMIPFLIRRGTVSVLACLLFFAAFARSEEPRRDQVLQAALKATQFLTQQVSNEGGYLWAYSEDLQLREGEGVVKTNTIWVQPPGTPTLGQCFVSLYRATGEQRFAEAAVETATALISGQMRSGGWQAMVEFDPQRRRKWAYRADEPARKKKDQSSLDDDKTQSALRFLIDLDQALEFRNAKVHEAALYGLKGLLERGQLSGGGFPQVWTDQRLPEDETPSRVASVPDQWPRTYPGHQQYWSRYTLNDHLAPDVMQLLLLADCVYDDPRYLTAARRLADSLLESQLPDPQPAWAQQYNQQMQPIWARKFEMPAIASSESFGVMRSLMMIARHTGEQRYLRPIPKALDYFERSRLPNGQLARFYELKSNRPIYFTKDYQLTYSDADLPTHYGFKISDQCPRLRQSHLKLARELTSERQGASVTLLVYLPSSSPVSEQRVKTVIDAMDSCGAWLSDLPMRYHKHSGPTIFMKETAKNLQLLASFLAANPSDR